MQQSIVPRLRPIFGLLAPQQHVARRLVSSFAKPNVQVPMLDRPIGMVDPPQDNDNDGIDRRSLQQKKEDFMNYEKHMQRRQELEHELGKGFDDVKQFKHTGGKFFTGPTAYFRADKALYMPNLWGKTLSGEYTTTSPLLRGNVSIVRMFGAITGEQQVKSYTDDQSFDLGVQLVDVNTPDSLVKEQLVKLFTYNIRRQTDPKQYNKYFITRKGLTKDIRRAIRAENVYAGYVFLVDAQCRIRWAASGDATVEEREYLKKFSKALLKEA